MSKLSIKMNASSQGKLLNDCASTGANLLEVLRGTGMSYDDLRYTSNVDIPIPKVKYERTDDLIRHENGIPAISFFAGAGGFDIGFYLAGFDNLSSVEINKTFCETLRLNFPKKLVIGPPTHSGNVKDRDAIANILKQKLHLTAPFEGVFHGAHLASLSASPPINAFPNKAKTSSGRALKTRSRATCYLTTFGSYSSSSPKFLSLKMWRASLI